jgi:hypothetical protein
MSPCNGCALTDGACANLEPKNQLTARICVRAGIPFYCHDTALADWRDPVSFKVAILKRQPVPICQGWTREVRRLAALGYFKEPEGGGLRVLQKQLGEMAIRALNKFVDTDEESDPYGKAHAREDLEEAIAILFEPTECERTKECV